ncbi:MAG: DUF1501 domain-containing protein [Pseudomonadota bacterium]|nr:DUF1501 domain-containing protein [Pseudomonadota bacterium]
MPARNETVGRSRRHFVQGLGGAAAAGVLGLPGRYAFSNERADSQPVLVAVELTGGNDGLNSVVPFGDDAYYRHRPRLGLKADTLLPLDDHFGLNPGMLGLHRLWQDGQLAIVHGCGYDAPSYSHFTSLAYWQTGAPHSGSPYGWLGRTADAMRPEPADNMLISVAAQQPLVVRSATHTPVVFDDPERFQRQSWMPAEQAELSLAPLPEASRNRAFLRAVDRGARASAESIRSAWQRYKTDVDYGIAPMDLPKVAACIAAGLPTQLYHVAFRNNAFDTHVQQAPLHRRLLSYACDGLHGFVRDLERLGVADRVLVVVYSEFGRRVPENANLGTDHGSANDIWVIGRPVRAGHHGQPPSLTALIDDGNLAYTTDFRSVFATLTEDWLGLPRGAVFPEALPRLQLLA